MRLNYNGSNLSIVIQGPITSVTTELVKKIKKELPQSEVIISTWKDQEIKFCSNDKLKILKLTDPGGYFSNKKEHLNVNRQILSTFEGVKISNKEYVFKIRSDILVNFNKVLKLYNNYNNSDNNKYFIEKVLILNLTSVNPRKRKRLFSFNDWIYVGCRKDLLTLFKCPMFPKKYVNFFTENPTTNLRYNAEQWIFINMIFGNQLAKIFPNAFVFNKKLLKSVKYSIYRFGLNHMYTHNEWKKEFTSENYYIDLERILYDFTSIAFLRRIVKYFRK